jgi:hypothetical protein
VETCLRGKADHLRRLGLAVPPPRLEEPKNIPKDDAMPRYRVTFSKELFGLPFPVAEISVIEALNEDRACRAATLRFMRRHGVADWRLRADRIEIERQPR